jgi:hypothetical protein
MTKQQKIQAALDAVAMTTPGDWWVDEFNDLKDGVGNFPLARDVGSSADARSEADRKVIAASRELAEEVLRLRALVKKAFMESVEGYKFPKDELEEAWEESNAKKELIP